MRYDGSEIILVAPHIINLRSMPCVGLGYIGAYLAAEGRPVRIVDAQFTKEDPLPVLAASSPTLVAIGVDSRTIERGLAIAAEAKRCGHITLLGGLHVSLIKGDILADPAVDFGIVGDGEVAMVQLLEALEGKRELADVSGLVYRGEDGARHVNKNTTETESLDSLPFPDYRLAGIDHFPLYPLVTSRDCPYKCIYCTVGSISHGRFRFRSAASCVDEIIAAKEKYNIRGFLVVDENFAANKKRALEFCRLLIERKVDLPWSAFEGIRADSLDEDFLALLKQAGCRWISFGIETAENAVLKTIEKGAKFARIEKSIALVRRFGLKVGGFMIVGLPDSTFETDMRSIEWATRTLDRVQFWVSIPYLGTPMHRWVKENGRLLREPIGDNVVNTLSTMPFYETPHYPADQVKRAHAIASLKTGIDFFFDYLDSFAGSPLERAYRAAPAYQQRLLAFAERWYPDYLPRLRAQMPPGDAGAERLLPAIGDDFDPLPPDMCNGRSTPNYMVAP